MVFIAILLDNQGNHSHLGNENTKVREVLAFDLRYS